MPSLTDIELPKPKDWQAFERLCADLWRCIWNDPNTQMNGRSGQEQHGVDVWGRPDEEEKWAGVQCKGRNTDYSKHSALSLDEVKAEIEKAEKFNPGISSFIIATTAPNDAALQSAVNALTAERIAQGKFTVHVYSWDEIQRRIAEHAEKIIPQHFPFLDSQRNDNDASNNLINQALSVDAREDIAERVAAKLQVKLSSTVLEAKPAAENETDTLENKILDQFRDLMKSGQAKSARQLIENFKAERWDKASDRIKFRILTNIGACNLRLGEEIAAAQKFLEAEQYAGDDPLGPTNVAFAYLLQNKIEEAHKAAKRAVERHPKHGRAYALLIASTPYDKQNNPLAGIPEAMLEDDEVSYAIAQFYFKTDRLDEGTRWIKKAYEKGKGELETKATYAQSLIEPLTHDPGIIFSSGLTGESLKILNEAIGILEEVWGSIKDKEAAQLGLMAANSLCVAYRLSNQPAKSDKVIEEALKINPKHPVLLRQAAVSAARRDDHKTALEILEQIKSDAFPDILLMKAEILEAEKRPDEALKVLDEWFKQSTGDESLYLAAEETRLRVFASTQGQDTAAKEAISKAQGDKHRAFFLALGSIYCSKEAEAQALALDAKKALTANCDFQEKVLVTQALNKSKQYKEEIEIYEEHINFNSDSNWLKNYLWMLLQIDDRAKLDKAFNALSLDLKKIPAYQKIEAAFLERVGRIEAALDLIDAYIKAVPTDIRAWFFKIDLLEKLNRAEEIKNILSLPIEVDKFSPIDCMRLAHLYNRYAQRDIALELGYKTLRTHSDIPKVCTTYTGLILFGDGNPPTHIDRVEQNIAVTLEDSSGKHVNYIIEDGIKYDKTYEISSDSHLGKLLVGKRVDEEIVIDTGIQQKKLKIIQLRHKYVYHLHQVMQDFNTRFPDEKGMVQVDLRGTNEEFDFSPVFDSVTKWQENRDAVEDEYRSKPLPIGMVATMLGVHPIDAWLGLANKGRVRIKVCLGNVPEREMAENVLRSNPKGYVVDVITLHAMHVHKVHDIILNKVGKLYICQSTLDSLNNLLEDRKEHLEQCQQGESMMTLTKEGERYIRQEISKEDLDRECKRVEGIISWAKNNCEIIPAIPKEAPPDIIVKLSTALDASFIDTLYAAAGNNLPLLCEDFGLRTIAKQFLGVEGVWIQPFLMRLLELDVMTQDDYDKARISLIAYRANFTSIDARFLFKIAQEDEFQRDKRLQFILSDLGTENSNIDSSIVVAQNFLAGIQQAGISADEKQKFVYMMLNSIIFPHHTSKLLEIVAEFCSGFVEARSRVFLEAVRNWLIGHFIPYEAWPEIIRRLFPQDS